MGAPRFWQAFAGLILSGLTACGTTTGANVAANSKWLGKPADEFFVKNGPPIRTHTLSSGGKVHSWHTLAMPSGTSIQLACTADIVTDPASRIIGIRLKEDTIGHWNTSRCTEVFGQ